MICEIFIKIGDLFLRPFALIYPFSVAVIETHLNFHRTAWLK